MFDFRSMFIKAVEGKMLDLGEYVFLPERVDLVLDGGQLSCVLNSNGRVDVIYSKKGISDVKTAMRKNPYTSFQDELAYGVYDNLVDEAIAQVNQVIEGRSKYFTL